MSLAPLTAEALGSCGSCVVSKALTPSAAAQACRVSVRAASLARSPQGSENTVVVVMAAPAVVPLCLL